MTERIGDNPEITQTLKNGYPDRLRPETETETEFEDLEDDEDR